MRVYSRFRIHNRRELVFMLFHYEIKIPDLPWPLAQDMTRKEVLVAGNIVPKGEDGYTEDAYFTFSASAYSLYGVTNGPFTLEELRARMKSDLIAINLEYKQSVIEEDGEKDKAEFFLNLEKCEFIDEDISTIKVETGDENTQ